MTRKISARSPACILAVLLLLGLGRGAEATTGSWEARAPLPEPRQEASVGNIGGEIYEIGKFAATGHDVTPLQRDDPATDSLGDGGAGTDTERAEPCRRRGGGRLGLSASAAFDWRCLISRAIAPFPLPAQRTGRADFPHPALRLASPQGTR